MFKEESRCKHKPDSFYVWYCHNKLVFSPILHSLSSHRELMKNTQYCPSPTAKDGCMHFSRSLNQQMSVCSPFHRLSYCCQLTSSNPSPHLISQILAPSALSYSLFPPPKALSAQRCSMTDVFYASKAKDGGRLKVALCPSLASTFILSQSPLSQLPSLTFRNGCFSHFYSGLSVIQLLGRCHTETVSLKGMKYRFHLAFKCG